MKKYRILYFYVHPAKFHLFKHSIEKLKQDGHTVDIAISDKDVLEELLTNSKIEHTNLFPKGRKSKYLKGKLNVLYALLLTLTRLYRFTFRKKYDVFVTDDALSLLGKWKGIPTLSFTDNDLSTTSLINLIYKAADKIVAPEAVSLDTLEYKKVAFKGNKAIAHLHPAYFSKDPNFPEKYGLKNTKFCIIRLALLNANHDLHGNPGITNKDVENILQMLPNDLVPVISTEREIPIKYRQFIQQIPPEDYTQLMANAHFFIGDSSTMATEAALLGVPNILINNIAKNLGVMKELKKNNLQQFFDNYADCVPAFKTQLYDTKLKEEFEKRSQQYINQSDDFNVILVNEILKLASKKNK